MTWNQTLCTFRTLFLLPKSIFLFPVRKKIISREKKIFPHERLLYTLSGKKQCTFRTSSILTHYIHDATGTVAILDYLNLYRDALLQFFHMTDDSHMSARLIVQ